MSTDSRRFRKPGRLTVACLWTLFVAGMTPAQATTIISVSGPNDTIGTNYLGYLSAVGFTTGLDYTNVDIGINLSAFSGTGEWDLEVFLTDQIGPGTTALANEIASATPHVSIPTSPLFPPYVLTAFTVLSVPLLPAGTYYLTVAGTYVSGGGGFWVGSQDSDWVVVTDTGASVTAPYLFSGVPDPYPPNSGFSALPPNPGEFGAWFTVTGDPVAAAVPEPSTFGFCLGGLLLLCGAHLRRSLASMES